MIFVVCVTFIRKKAAQKSPFRPGRKQILKPFNSMKALAELPCHEELVIPIQPKIISSIEIRFTITHVYIQGEILLECQLSLYSKWVPVFFGSVKL